MRHALVMFALAALAGCGNDRASTEPEPEAPSPPAPTFVRLESDPGDHVGGGRSYEYTNANAAITVSIGSSGTLDISIRGDERWNGVIATPIGTPLSPGTYPNATRYLFRDSTAGLDWSGEGRGCNDLTGSFTIDSLVYNAGLLSYFDARLEQQCGVSPPGLRVTIHWWAADTTKPPGPVHPVPSTAWAPPAGSVADAGTYVYLQSDAGDAIGNGHTNTYTRATTNIQLTQSNGRLTFRVGDIGEWRGEFQAMNTLSRLEQGYYGGLLRYPFHNPVRGGLAWSGYGRGCNTITGWFAIDHVAYEGNALTALDLRFAQHCSGAVAALRGAIRWRP